MILTHLFSPGELGLAISVALEKNTKVERCEWLPLIVQDSDDGLLEHTLELYTKFKNRLSSMPACELKIPPCRVVLYISILGESAQSKSFDMYI